MSHNEYQNQKDYDSQTKKEEEVEKEEEEKVYKCSDCDSWVKSTESCCGEEEDEEEELDICGEKGREFDLENPVKGCGKKITEDMENIMIGNISFCGPCGEVGMELWEKNEECPCGEGWVNGCGDPRCQPMSKEEEE